ncbi:MAG: hypothetical protein HW421_2606 [Ignavibacteria bacterium]|nr:hypothetical protein [Ignavibacteria bacterium]
MRKLLILFLLLFYFKSSFLYPQDTVKGGFTKCITYEYSYQSGILDTNSKRLLNFRKYNNNGNMVKYHYFNTIVYDTSWVDEFYTYNSFGKLIEIYHDEPLDSTEWKSILNYDSSGNLIEKIHYKPLNNPVWKKLYKYNTHGQKIEEEEYYKPLDSIKLKKTYKYNHIGKLIEETEINGWGDPKITYTYDEFNRLIEEIHCFYNGTKIERHIHKYDSIGNEIESRRIEQRGAEFIYSLQYDSKRNLIKWIEIDPGMFCYNFQNRTYDENGKLLSLSDPNQKAIWKYDKFGNIIEYIEERIENNEFKPRTKTIYIYSNED